MELMHLFFIILCTSVSKDLLIHVKLIDICLCFTHDIFFYSFLEHEYTMPARARARVGSQTIQLYNITNSDICWQDPHHIQGSWHSFIDAKCRRWSYKSDAICKRAPLRHQVALAPWGVLLYSWMAFCSWKSLYRVGWCNIEQLMWLQQLSKPTSSFGKDLLPFFNLLFSNILQDWSQKDESMHVK